LGAGFTIVRTPRALLFLESEAALFELRIAEVGLDGGGDIPGTTTFLYRPPTSEVETKPAPENARSLEWMSSRYLLRPRFSERIQEVAYAIEDGVLEIPNAGLRCHPDGVM